MRIQGLSTLRTRAPMVLVVLACVGALTAALTGAVSPMPGMRFLPPGHWIFNSVLGAVFHIDGATANLDAQGPMSGDPGSQIVQGDTSGYVVGRSKITQFGKSTLSVEQTSTPPADELPVGIEAAGGPYLVYRNHGIVMRLGEPAARVETGGPVGDPVVTGDGTMWLFRTGSGLLCKLPRGANAISGCPTKAPEGHTGALTVVADRPQFVDTSAATLNPVNDNGLGTGKPLGVATSAASRPSATDVSGRVAILDPDAHRMHLVDTAGAAPVTVSLPDGDYDGPTCTGSVVVMVDRKSDTVLTYGVDGKQRDAKPLPKDNGHPRLARGEDARVYVEGAEGTHVAVVDKEGKVVDVPVTGGPAHPDQQPKPADEPQSTDPRSNPPGGEERPPPQEKPQQEKPQRGPPAPKPPPTVPATVPGAPTSVSATAGAGSATVSWGAAPDNKSPITSYLVSWPGGSLSVGGGARSATVPNLTNGTRYTISVAAVNKVGRGPAVAANPVTPAGSPGLPQNLTVNATTKHVDATVTWAAAPANGAPITAYHVSWRRDDGSRPGSATVPAATLSYVIKGIWSGTDIPFTVTVVAENSFGQGPPASAHKAPPPKTQTITIAEGAPTTGDRCHAPDCARVNATLTGFEPNTTYRLTLSTPNNPQVQNPPEPVTTDANGSATYNELDYDVPGQTVWIQIQTPSGLITSNKIVWKTPS